MSRKNKLFNKFSALCVVLLLMTGCAGRPADTEESPEEALSTPTAAFPTFSATDLDGNTVTESIFKDKDLTVLNIWGTFCGPCIREMPELGEWAREMPDNVQILGLIIDIDGEDDTEHHDLAVDITQKAAVDYTNLVANADFSTILEDVYGVPTTLFIDGDGNIVGAPIIGADVDGYKKFAEEYLNEQ